jgi:preprotein translocase SecE subunit
VLVVTVVACPKEAEVSETQNNHGGEMAARPGRDDGGFFTIRRRGQGKWTRLGTAIVSALIIVGTGLFIYNDVRANTGMTEKTALIVAAVFIMVMTLVAFWLQNTANNVSFLIDTDSEMKKVNWTTRKELIGSTKIVIGFMLIMAGMLFIVDIIFGYFFYFVGVLKFSPGIFDMFFKGK